MAEAVEENEIAGPDFPGADRAPVRVLGRSVVRQVYSELSVDVGNKTGAIEAAR